MSFSLSNARERPPTRTASAQMYACPVSRSPTRQTNPTPARARSSTSSVSALRSSARWFPKVTGSCCTKRDGMLVPACRATDMMPRHTTRLHAVPSRADSRRTRPHIRDTSRTSTRCYARGRARTRSSQRALVQLATSTKHRSIFRKPYQALTSHAAAGVGSS